MSNKLPKPKASTQAHLDIEDITDDLVILKTGWVANVLATTAVNFDLLSEAEQDATIYAYGALLNSLSFPLEILIRSKKADITSYFDSLEEAERAQPNPDLKLQIQKYQDFLRSTVQQKTVLDKKFYLIINFNPLQQGLKGVALKNKSRLISEAKIALTPKRDHIIAQTARLGLSTRGLTTQELIELFYDIYNPAPTGTQRVILDTASYTTPLVEPALEVPTPAPATSDVAPIPESSPITSPQSTTAAPVTSNQIPQPEAGRPLDEATNLRPAPPASTSASDRPITQNPPSQPPLPTSTTPTQNATQVSNPEQSRRAQALEDLRQATQKATQILGKPFDSAQGEPTNQTKNQDQPGQSTINYKP